MLNMWISLASLPETGQSFVIEDQKIWADPIKEFGLDYAICVPIKAELFLLARISDIKEVEQVSHVASIAGAYGCLVRGHLYGKIVMPCDRCAEEAIIGINASFENFEPVSDQNMSENYDADLDINVIRLGDNGAEINLAALLWEEFSLALPIHPLCSSQCAGLCPICGQNLNKGMCNCAEKNIDPRFDILRKLRIKKHAPAPSY